MAVKYTKNEIKNKIFVPTAVESELKTNIENQLNKCGIFYRVFSRRKSAASLEHKFASNKYGGDDGKKIQDLIGIRVNVYFQDDLDICKKLFEDKFQLVEEDWAETDMSRQNFEATKINGVFRLPEYLAEKISPETWDMAIDKTFEIQLKTVFFEGWHEVEHDFRYKLDGKDPDDPLNLWNRHANYSRQLNSIVATLELCDRSMVSMFESFSHDLYKNQEWEMMLRMHYRVRMSDIPLYEGLSEILGANQRELGKKLLKTSRIRLIEALKTVYRSVPISVNMIVAVLNDIVLGGNEAIHEIMTKNNVFNDGRVEAEKGYERKELSPLTEYNVFSNKVLIRNNKNNLSNEEVFKKVSGHVYKWVKEKYREIFPNMPVDVCRYSNDDCGYKVLFDYDLNALTLSMKTVHIAFDVGGRMWTTEVELWPDDNNAGIWMEIKNSMRDREIISVIERISRFSYPNFYKYIYKDRDLKLYDVDAYGNHPYGLKESHNIDKMVELIENSNRNTPVVLLASNNNENGILDEKWIGERWIDGLYNQVKYYAHIYRCDVEQIKEILDRIKVNKTDKQGVYVFWPKGENYGDKEVFCFYDEQEINDCIYSRYKGEGAGILEDDIRDGAMAFMFKLVDEVKKHSIK